MEHRVSQSFCKVLPRVLIINILTLCNSMPYSGKLCDTILKFNNIKPLSRYLFHFINYTALVYINELKRLSVLSLKFVRIYLSPKQYI
jgi:hypothetical protein